jgi:hypothetical protein
MKPICIPRFKAGVFYRAGLEADLIVRMAFLSNGSRKPEPKSKLAQIKDLIRKSEIEVEADILEKYKPDAEAKLDMVFEKGGRAFAYYHFEKGNGARRYWQRYRVEGGRPVIDAVFPVVNLKQGV